MTMSRGIRPSSNYQIDLDFALEKVQMQLANCEPKYDFSLDHWREINQI